MQVGFVGFLIIKRRQLLKNTDDRYENCSWKMEIFLLFSYKFFLFYFFTKDKLMGWNSLLGDKGWWDSEVGKWNVWICWVIGTNVTLCIFGIVSYITLHCLGHNEKQKKLFPTSLLMFCCALTCLMYNDDVRSIWWIDNIL
jgi:hypothetical protein